MAKVVLIYPKRDGRVFGRVPGSPYTLMRLASLVPDSIPVEIWDENREPIPYSNIRPGDLVGITSMTHSIDRARDIALKVKERGGTVAVGGVHATLSPEDVAKWADIVNVGEAYRTWPQIVQDHFSGGAKPYYCDEEWNSLEGVAPLTDRVIKMVAENREYWTPYLEITRGCPRNCSFCTAIRVSGQKMRLRPIPEVIEEIERRKIRRFFLTDDNFGLNFRLNPEYTEQLLRALAKLPLTGWTAQAEQMVGKYPELLDLAREAHLDKLFIGFESINPKNKRNLGGKSRGIQDEYRQVIKTCHDHGIGVVGLFVFGFDDDTLETFEETWKFIRESELDSVSVTVLTPYPGTPQRAQLEREGRLLDVPWSYYDTSHVTFIPKQMTVDELREAYDWLCKKVYSPYRIAQRGLRSLRRYPMARRAKKLMASFGTDVGYWRTYRFRYVS
ncbi:MAG: radical SAM protein [Chloroflexota bacterium]|nr:B12-binding domain-containing radical SAM protein [Dehalococcoidia bacterium]MDW8253447.1 radical SAM protein [Chloroflexota bacterium]